VARDFYSKLLDGLAHAKDLVEQARDVGEVLSADVDDALSVIGRIELDVEQAEAEALARREAVE
jgi:hypothetical protein